MRNFAKKAMAARSRKADGPFGRNRSRKTSERICIIMLMAIQCNTRFLRPGSKPIEALFTTLRLARQRAGDRPSPRVDNRGSSPVGSARTFQPAMTGLPTRANAAIGYAQNRCMNGNFPKGGSCGAGRLADVISMAAIRFMMAPQSLGLVPGIAEGGLLSSQMKQ
jgi:hypothetical protein